MENWLTSPFTFTLLSLTAPAGACGRFCNGDIQDAQCKSPTSERYFCLCFFASAFLCFPPPPFESQCIPFQCGGLEAAITSSHIWDVWAKPLCHQLYLFHFCLNYFWVFFFTFFLFFIICMQKWGVQLWGFAQTFTSDNCYYCSRWMYVFLCGVCLLNNFQKYADEHAEDIR